MESRNARSLAASGGRRRDSDSADTRCARRNQSTGARYHSAGSLAPLDQAGVAGWHGGVDRRRRAVDCRALDGLGNGAALDRADACLCFRVRRARQCTGDPGPAFRLDGAQRRGGIGARWILALLLARDPPDRPGTIFRHEQRAVMRDGDANRPPPHLRVVEYKAGHEVLVFTGGYSIPEADTNDLVARALRPVPRTVLRGESVAAVFVWKCAGIVKGQPKRGRMRLYQDIRNRHFAVEIGTLTGVAGVFVLPDIEPRPAIERSFPHPRDVVRHQIIAHAVTLVGRAIWIPGCGMDRRADAISDTGGEHAPVFSIGVERQHVGSICFASPRCAQRMFVDP